MSTFTVKTEIRWSDIDPNFHVLHSKYYDYCANARLLIMAQYGITMQVLQEEHIGPILFREEAVFKKELKFGDEIWKNNDTLAAIVTVDGAWLDTVKRKLAIPSERFKNAFAQMPKAENYNQYKPVYSLLNACYFKS